MRSKTTCLLLCLVLLSGCGGDGSGPGERSLVGVWDFMEYSDHGVWASASGIVEFGDSGDFAVDGEITYPGEPAESLTVNGSWTMIDDRVLLETSEGSGEWNVEFSDAEVTLTLVGPVPTNVIRLCCREPSSD